MVAAMKRPIFTSSRRSLRRLAVVGTLLSGASLLALASLTPDAVLVSGEARAADETAPTSATSPEAVTIDRVAEEEPQDVEPGPDPDLVMAATEEAEDAPAASTEAVEEDAPNNAPLETPPSEDPVADPSAAGDEDAQSPGEKALVETSEGEVPQAPTEAETAEVAPEQAKGGEAGLTSTDKQLVKEISAYFNKITTLKGRFDQQNDDGTVSSGTFYMQRPGRMRFEYDDPNPLTLLADGFFVMLNDRELESVDRYPLRETPLYLILKKDVDLLDDAEIVDVQRQGEMVAITAREDDGVAEGDLTLVFVGPRLELRHWIVTDVQGSQTLVSLRNVVLGEPLDPELFRAKAHEFGIEGDD